MAFFVSWVIIWFEFVSIIDFKIGTRVFTLKLSKCITFRNWRFKIIYEINMFKRVLSIIDIPIAIFWGLIAYLYSMMVFSSIGLIIEIFYSSPKIESKIKIYFPTFLKCSVYSLIMALVIVLCSKYLLIGILLAKRKVLFYQ